MPLSRAWVVLEGLVAIVAIVSLSHYGDRPARICTVGVVSLLSGCDHIIDVGVVKLSLPLLRFQDTCARLSAALPSSVNC